MLNYINYLQNLVYKINSIVYEWFLLERKTLVVLAVYKYDIYYILQFKVSEKVKSYIYNTINLKFGLCWFYWYNIYIYRYRYQSIKWIAKKKKKNLNWYFPNFPLVSNIICIVYPSCSTATKKKTIQLSPKMKLIQQFSWNNN